MNPILDWFTGSHKNGYTPRLLKSKVVLYVAVALLVVKIVSVGLHIPFPRNIFFADITKNHLTSLLNQSRQAQGLGILAESSALDQAAYLKAQDMVKGGYFAHQSPQGVTPWHWFSQVGYAYAYAGENLAVGFIDSPEVFDAWLNSPGHLANILNSHYTQVGTAVVPGFEGNSVVVVQFFGSPKTVSVTPKPAAAAPMEQPAPAPAPNLESAPESEPVSETPLATQTPSSGPQVLGTQNATIEKYSGKATNEFYLRWLNFWIYGNGQAFQYVGYLLLLAVTTCLFINIIWAAEKLHAKLVFRSLAVIAILCVSLAMNTSLLVWLIPHQLLII